MKATNLKTTPDGGSLVRRVRRIPVTLLCFVAHMTGFGVALTIGKDFWPFILCAMTGLACIFIGMRRDEKGQRC